MKLKKYLINSITVLLIILVSITSCDKKEDGNISVTEVTIDLTTIVLVPYGKQQLTATVVPNSATNKKIIWESNDFRVATVNDDGKVTAIAVGKTIITATTENGNKMAQCEVMVEGAVISATDLKLSYYGNRLMEPNEEVDLIFGPTLYLFAVVSSENTTIQNVMWENSDDTVATMTVYGGGDRVGINALAEGKTTITVATEDGKETASCVVNVFQLKSPSIRMKVSYGNISDYSFTSGDVLRVKQGTRLNFKIQVTQGAPQMQTFRIISWIEAKSTETIVMEENLYKGIYEGKNEYEFEYTAIVGNNEEVLFFELVDEERFFVAQVTIEPY